MISGRARLIWDGRDYGTYKGWRTDTGALIQPEDWAVARVLSTGTAELNQEVDIECFDGSHKTIINAAVPMKDDRQRLTGVIAIHQDITERRQNEKELATLYNASSFLFKSDSLLNLAHQVVQAVVQEFGQMDCGLVLRGHVPEEISLIARSGQFQALTSASVYEGSRSLIVHALTSGSAVYAPDARNDPRYTPRDLPNLF